MPRTKFDDEHRIFLQGIMCKGILNDKEVHALHLSSLKACSVEIPEKRQERDQLLVKNIQTINDEIEKLGLKIRKGQDEDTGKSCFMLINNNNRMVAGSRDLGTQVQVKWSQQQLEYLRLVATEILQSEDKAVTSRAALLLTDRVQKKNGKKMSLEEAETTINELIVARWIKPLDGNKKLTLDVRFIGEMEGWMVEVMGAGNVAFCKACRKVVVRGRYCHCAENIAWHNYCIEKQVSRGVDVKCMTCNTKISEGDKSKSGANSSSTSTEVMGSKALGEEQMRPDRQRGEPSKKMRSKGKSLRDDDVIDLDNERGEPSKNRRGRRQSNRDDEAEPSPALRGRSGRIKRRMSGDDSSDSD